MSQEARHVTLFNILHFNHRLFSTLRDASRVSGGGGGSDVDVEWCVVVIVWCGAVMMW